jgi:hypothetical protein
MKKKFYKSNGNYIGFLMLQYNKTKSFKVYHQFVQILLKLMNKLFIQNNFKVIHSTRIKKHHHQFYHYHFQ